MKYVVLIGDGMSDYPLDELNGKTPLQVANKPNIDELTFKGRAGQLKTIPENLNPGSDVANMGIFGYNPQKYYSGRGPLEAGSMGIETSKNDVIFRCNLITEKNGILDDFNAGHITSEEAAILINDLNEYFSGKGKFYSGVSYRHLFIRDDIQLKDLKTTPPHDMVGEKIDEYINWNNKSSLAIKDIMLNSKKVLENHEVNKKRIANNKKPANMIWLWGQGLKPNMPLFKDLYGINGSTITGVDLIKGIGFFSGLNNINVPGATGYFDTDYKAKGKYAANALKDSDIVFVHVESPDEAGHVGSIDEKIKAIEQIDKHVLSPIVNNIGSFGDYKIAILPDHATPIDIRTHTRDPVPLAIYSSCDGSDNVKVYDEKSVVKGSLRIDNAFNLVKRLINS
jgi:2,3-bisphosphoglycerate-independent phosphoglycerate mutase